MRAVVVAFTAGLLTMLAIVQFWGLPNRVDELEDHERQAERVLLAVRLNLCWEIESEQRGTTNDGNPAPAIRYLLNCRQLEEGRIPEEFEQIIDPHWPAVGGLAGREGGSDRVD